MAFNPSPEVAAARDIGKQFDKTKVIILMLDNDTIQYASFGRTTAMCKDAKKLADIAYDAVMAELTRRAYGRVK